MSMGGDGTRAARTRTVGFRGHGVVVSGVGARARMHDHGAKAKVWRVWRVSARAQPQGRRQMDGPEDFAPLLRLPRHAIQAVQ